MFTMSGVEIYRKLSIKIDLIDNAYVGDGKKKEKEENSNQGTEEIIAVEIFHLLSRI